MIDKCTFDSLLEETKLFAFHSFRYLEYTDLAEGELICRNDDLLLAMDRSHSPAIAYWAVDTVDALVKGLAGEPAELHFVPKALVADLEAAGFSIQCEYADFFLDPLTQTDVPAPLFLPASRCSEASGLSRRCAGQARGFKGEDKAWFADWLAEGNQILIAEQDSFLTGFCCISIYNDGTTLWIREIAVDPVFQRQGIGEQLLRQAFRQGVAGGARKAFLAVDIENHSAIRLYERLGFRRRGKETEIQMAR